ncbi:hypothetical protein MFLAVUS_009678 [Mucor flavus]|uniref:Leucine-rich PPR motif-containing protein, mitochondrial n=1 Tax=Mucor flavus TaxID=439312 RepID=A0ABP9ZAK9_9FUNG
MSISRESWKSQKLLAQVCGQCLSKRILVTPVKFSRGLGTQSVKESSPTPVPSLLESFRQELYQPTHNDLALSYSPWVKKAIQRRQGRKRVLNMYQLMKNRHESLLSQLSQTDIDLLVQKFMTNPDDPSSNGPSTEAFEILQDLKEGQLFTQAKFRQEEMELMIYLASELKLTKRALSLLTEATEQYDQLNISSYESVFGLLASQKKQMKKMEYWLQHLEKVGLQPTKSIVRSVVLSKLMSNQLEEASAFLRKHHPADALTQLVNRHIEDPRELLDNALNVFAVDCLEEWRLNQTRHIYSIKRELGMSTSVIVKRLMDKALFTGHVHTAERMLKDTITMEDTANALTCSKRLIQWYVSQKNIKHAMLVWEQMEHNGLIISQDVMEGLLVHAAKLKYHVDTMKLYRRCNHLYPTSTEASIYVLQCMVRSKAFTNATLVGPEVESALDKNIKPHLARIACKALFSLSAQTGDINLFERVFGLSEKLKLSLTHRGLTSLTATYLKLGDVELAKQAFQTVASHTEGPDVVDFNLLMRMIVLEDGKVDYEKIFDVLKHMDLVNVSPNETTLRTMATFYKSQSEMQDSLYQKLLQHPSSVSRFNQIFLNNLALSSLLTRIDISKVAGVFFRNNRAELFPNEKNDRILVNGITYKLLLDAANEDRGHTSIAEKLLKDMLSRGLKPTRDVYECIIRNLAKKGKITKARKYIAQMEQDTGEKANAATYTKLIDGFLYLKKPLLAKSVITEDIIKNNIPLDDVVEEKLKKIERILKTRKK